MMRRRVHAKPEQEADVHGRSGSTIRKSKAPPSVAGVAGSDVSAVAQRASVDEEELLQGSFSTAQRESIEEEEPLQGRFDVAQRVSVDDDEEMLQGKFSTAQRASIEDDEEMQMKRAAPPRNATGIPDTLKAGIESLSGISLDDVRVHFNSPQPAQLNALAYAQGTDIHVAPGQERHLPHEAWHIVQQAQGRVKPTTRLQPGVAVNDDKSLEREADTMGARASGFVPRVSDRASRTSDAGAGVRQLKNGKRKGKGKFTTAARSPGGGSVTDTFISSHMGNRANAVQTAARRGLPVSHTIDIRGLAALLGEMHTRQQTGYHVPQNQVPGPHGRPQYLTANAYNIWETESDSKGRMKKTTLISRRFFYDAPAGACHHFDGIA